MRADTRGEAFRFFLWILLVLGGLAALAVSVQAYWLLTQTTEQDVRDSIAENLRMGSSSQEIFQYLDAQGMEHSGIREGGSDTFLQEAGYPPRTKVISAIRHNTSRSWLSTGQISVYFILDASNRLEDYIVKETFTSF